MTLHARLARRALLPIAAMLGATPAFADYARVRYVTDGDTFRLESGERIRIAGIDAPETRPDQAKCRRERVLGEAAAAEARALLDDAVVTIERVGRSYNRTVARVRVSGQDVAALLVARGAARWWPAHTPKPDWCRP